MESLRCDPVITCVSCQVFNYRFKYRVFPSFYTALFHNDLGLSSYLLITEYRAFSKFKATVHMNLYNDYIFLHFRAGLHNLRLAGQMWSAEASNLAVKPKLLLILLAFFQESILCMCENLSLGSSTFEKNYLARHVT
jgi:hypothetical protein